MRPSKMAACQPGLKCPTPNTPATNVLAQDAINRTAGIQIRRRGCVSTTANSGTASTSNGCRTS